MQWNNAMTQEKKYPSTIAIDGPAASGKSSVGKIIADKMNYRFLDTGAMYRAVTYAVIQKGIDVDNEQLVGDVAEAISIDVRKKADSPECSYDIFINSQKVTEQLKSAAVNQLVSQVSRYKRVRTAMTAQQKLIGKTGAIVMAGRDIGTVVFILQNVQMRDEIDSTREIAPLKMASDAHIINTDAKNIEQVAAEIIQIISK